MLYKVYVGCGLSGSRGAGRRSKVLKIKELIGSREGMQVSSRRRRNRRARHAGANGNGSGRIRSPHRATSKSVQGMATVAGRVNGARIRPLAEMDRSDPQFKAALKSFSAAARFFHRQNYQKAQELFEK